MVGRRADCIAPFRYHAGAGDIGTDFLPGEMPPDTRFCSLANLYFYGSSPLKIVNVNAETA